MNAIAIDVVTDIVCPWCFIGLSRLDKVLAANGVTATISHHPFFLDPDTPAEGIDVPSMLKRKYGRDPAAIFERAEQEARSAGIDLDLSKQPLQRPTDRAHTLVRLAVGKGRQHELARALFQAHFLAGRNIADPAVLAEIAEPYGFSREETLALLQDLAELAETRRQALGIAGSGIGGVPFFVFGGRLALSGAQPETEFAKAISEVSTAV